MGENIIQAKIKKLREVQIRLESEEDYDEANLVNQQIKELVDQGDNYKYQQPLLDKKVILCVSIVNFIKLFCFACVKR